MIEDTATTAADLLNAGYAPGVVTMVELLTKPDTGVSYQGRIAAIVALRNRGAVGDAVMRLIDRMPGTEVPVRAGSLQGLNLALLVDGQHHGVGGQIL